MKQVKVIYKHIVTFISIFENGTNRTNSTEQRRITIIWINKTIIKMSRTDQKESKK